MTRGLGGRGLPHMVRLAGRGLPEIGPDGWRIQMARETRGTRFGSAGAGDPGPGFGRAQKGVFRKEGEYWTVGIGGKNFFVKNTNGLWYLAPLLAHPRAEFPVLVLGGRNRKQPPGAGTNAPVNCGHRGA